MISSKKDGFSYLQNYNSIFPYLRQFLDEDTFTIIGYELDWKLLQLPVTDPNRTQSILTKF